MARQETYGNWLGPPLAPAKRLVRQAGKIGETPLLSVSSLYPWRVFSGLVGVSAQRGGVQICWRGTAVLRSLWGAQSHVGPALHSRASKSPGLAPISGVNSTPGLKKSHRQLPCWWQQG